MTRVLLIKPRFHSALGHLVDEIPIGLEYIAAAIESTVDRVILADIDHDKINIKKELTKVKPDLIGITGQMAWHNEIVHLVRLARKIRPESTIIAGGYYPSLFSQLLKIIPELDFIVKGEGEKTFLEICELGLDDPYQIKGLVFRDGERVVTSGSRPLIMDLDFLRFPARHLRRSFYTHMQFPGRYYDVLTSARGCVGLCSFCCEPYIYGKPRRRSPKNLILEIDEIVKYHNNHPLQISMTDPNFMGRTKNDADRIFQLCDLLEERDYDLSFSILVRADMVARNPELVNRMVQSGFYFYELGIEAPDPKILRGTKKGESIQTMFRASKVIHKAEGFPLGTLMFGFDDQTKANIMQYPSYAQKLGLREAAFAISTPLIGTEFFQEVQNLIFESNFERYNYLHPTFDFNPHISNNSVYYLMGYCYGAFYRPSLMKWNDEYYERLIPSGNQIPISSYLRFAFKALRDFSPSAMSALLRGALTGILAARKLKNNDFQEEIYP